MADRPFDLTIDPSVAYRIVELIREYDGEEFAPPPDEEDDFGDEPVSSEDEVLEHLEEEEDDPLVLELSGLIDSLDIDAQRDLLALIWFGRDDYSRNEWSSVRRQARETEHLHLLQYIEQTPLASDYIASALDDLGYPAGEYSGE